MNIAIIGSGYVGLLTGACFSEFGVNVTCVDYAPQKMAALGFYGTSIGRSNGAL